MSGAIALPGLRADSPAAALALYGIAEVLATDADVCWMRDGPSWCGQITTPRCADAHELSEVLVEGIQADSLLKIESVAKDVNAVTADSWAVATNDESTIAHVIIGLCAEAPLRSDARLSLTPLCVYSFGTRGTLFGNAAKQDSAIDPQDLQAILLGPWKPKKGYNTLGLDPSARRQDGAIMGVDPSADGIRGVPGLVPLMLRGLHVVPPMPGGNRVRGGAFARGLDGPEFRWPIFTSPVASGSLGMLVARDWVAPARSSAQRAAAGVEAVFGARILRPAGRVSGRLALGRRVA